MVSLLIYETLLYRFSSDPHILLDFYSTLKVALESVRIYTAISDGTINLVDKVLQSAQCVSNVCYN